jgi:TonB family protein
MSELSARLSNSTNSKAETVRLIGRLDSPHRESRLKILFSNLRDFLVERPVKYRGGRPPAFAAPEFGESLGDNLKEFFRSAPRGPVRSDLLVQWEGGASGFLRNIRDAISPPKLPPLQVTSKPVDVPEIWSKNTQFTRVQALSIAFHVLVLVLVIVPFLPSLLNPSTTKANNEVQVTQISPYLPKLPAAAKRGGGGGGGGEHNIQPASSGKLPKFSWSQLTPPAVKPMMNPKLAVTPTVLGAPNINIPSPNAQNWGDPLSKVINDSSGTGSGSGIGSGSGGGVGSGNGGGVGPGSGYGTGGGPPCAGCGGYGSPQCVYCPAPQYSDEAVKAKYQGVVYLMATITADGRAIDIRVAKGLGLGLDEKAIEAVRSWRFKPALGPDGRPSAVSAPIEVTFRLF